MKKIFKQIAALLTAAAMVASLAACSQEAQDTATPSDLSQTDLVPLAVAEQVKINYTEKDASCELSGDGQLRLSKGSGIYESEFELEITSENDATIYYTLDGSDPATSATRIEYTAPVSIKSREGDASVVSAVHPVEFSGAWSNYNSTIKRFTSNLSVPDEEDVDKCTVVRAIAQNADGTATSPVGATYFIGKPSDHIEGIEENCEATGGSLAVISITTDYANLFDMDNGIYVKGTFFEEALAEKVAQGEWMDGETARALNANYKQKGREWERFAHIDFLEMDASGSQHAFSQDCGIRIQGNYSRSDAQKSFRFYARSDYGENNFRYAIFGDRALDEKGETLDKFKTFVVRAGGNCAFTAKYNDTYWQSLLTSYDCDTKASRPCVVYLNGEYWGLYVLEEDYSNDYYEDHYGVNKDNVVIYKGDAESLALGYKLDEGDLPEGETDESYYFYDLLDFFRTHDNLKEQTDYEEFCTLVDEQSVMDYFAAQIWINNKWDWPGKNWSMWRTTEVENGNEYADTRWRFSFYDMEFGGVSGRSDATTNTIKDDNYKPKGLLDMDTDNPAVLCYAYLMTNEQWSERFFTQLENMSKTVFEKQRLLDTLTGYEEAYGPLYDQFFDRYPGTGSKDNALYGGYASSQCIRDFVAQRENNIDRMINWARSCLQAQAAENQQ